MADDQPAAAPAAPRRPPAGDHTVEVRRGFDAVYRRTGAIAERAEHTAVVAQALLELLVAKGVVGMDEVEAAVAAVAPAISNDFDQEDLALALRVDPPDKYDPAVATSGDVDCERRVHLCHGACCRLLFAAGPQDVEEGIVEWDLRRPYLVKKRPDGRCVHQDDETLGCGVYPYRPVTCRTYSCRDDKRIWLDFDAYQPHPDLMRLTEPGAPARAATVRVSLAPTRRPEGAPH